jgi:hypothetical protein
MKLKTYLNQTKKNINTLNVFDIDDTLGKTSARVTVMKNGKAVNVLDPGEFNSYKLAPGESFDFAEFRSGKIFRDTFKPISNVLDRAKDIVMSQSENSHSIILTARADFNDHKEFLQAFRDHGFPIDHVYVERSGNLSKLKASSPAHINKGVVLKRYMKTGKFDRVRMWDDHEANLDMLLKLGKQFTNIEVIGYLVKGDKVSKYNRNLEEEIEIPKIGMTFSRDLMPQIKSSDISNFLIYLNKQNIDHKTKKLPVKELRSTQSEFDLSKIDQMIGQRSDTKILVSNDGYVMDGHHRWLADYNADKESKINSIVVDLPILELLRVAKEYSGTEYKSVSKTISGIIKESIHKSRYNGI